MWKLWSLPRILTSSWGAWLFGLTWWNPRLCHRPCKGMKELMCWPRRKRRNHPSLRRWRSSLQQIAKPWTSSVLRNTKQKERNMWPGFFTKSPNFRLGASALTWKLLNIYIYTRTLNFRFCSLYYNMWSCIRYYRMFFSTYTHRSNIHVCMLIKSWLNFCVSTMGPSIIFKWLFTAKGGGGVHEEPLLDGPRRWLEYPCWSGCHDPCISSPQPGKYFRLHKREQSHSQINFLFAILGLKSVLVCTHPTNAGRSQWTRLLWWVGSTWQKLGCWPRRTSIKQVSGVRKSLPRALWVAWWSFSILLAAVIFVSPFFKDCHQKKQISMLRCRCHFGFATACFDGWVWGIAQGHPESRATC